MYKDTRLIKYLVFFFRKINFEITLSFYRYRAIAGK